MFNALINSLKSGSINVIDTAINYRYQKSERSIGAALQYLHNVEKIGRDEYFLCSKGGFLPEDADQGIPSQVLVNELINKGKIKQDDIVGNCHCMHPNYLEEVLEKSLDNLGVECLDLYYLHNTSEVQMPVLGEKVYWKKLQQAFEFLERQIQLKKIKNYGIATWLAFRSPPNEEKIHLSLEKVVQLAEKIGGKNNGFKFIQLPINIMMAECFSEKWQKFQNQDLQLLRVARELEINVIVSSTLMGGKLFQSPLQGDIFKQCKSNATRHLQLIRSIPSTSICSALVGHKSYKNVMDNLELGKIPLLTEDEFWDYLLPLEEEDIQQK
ncbi:hypothetical protein IMG5_180500 [Ichthyophthirius multifiliis]|uniref:NADP-dependent oxidoreductase domain-containing protein n=1 Tax=Ichthyophthirius multifiliis TaxID=5932 RepID=G0R2Q6_ICHMU|nr:hypothetical protein IMG5_180500 [Ichthyophthirius multifiliis]EGR28250.1 hypothetical protein IMG5_180500 [Ichthyophthirius multifiliis]|eukprot:XP_004027595.1 hypothetical protein IMG5_180500 [Ichthyophthirius multifiliis]